MKTATKTRTPSELKVAASLVWEAADQAYERGQQAYLDWCKEIAKLYAEGTKTQEQIAERYQKDQSRIAQHIAIGRDQRIISNTNSLPKSSYAVFLLTTLPDKEFKEYCKPTTTQAVIIEVKKRLSAPKPEPTPQRPPCPGAEGIGPGCWKWSEGFGEWLQQPKVEIPYTVHREQPKGQLINKPTMPARDWVIEHLKFAKEDTIIAVLKTIRSCNHPDRGGSHEITVICNQYLEDSK